VFINNTNFKYTDFLTENHPTIVKEFKKLGNQKFHPWPSTKDAPEVIHDGKWLIRPVYTSGKFFNLAVRNYPETVSLLEQLDHLDSVVLSFLPPNTHIYPHTGYNKTRVIRVHLGLVVPKRVRKEVIVPDEDCWIRVVGETKTWEKGGLLILDDTLEHEAQNNTSEDRVVMMLDFYEGAFNDPV
jgi:beta-hydroxylase